MSKDASGLIGSKSAMNAQALCVYMFSSKAAKDQRQRRNLSIQEKNNILVSRSNTVRLTCDFSTKTNNGTQDSERTSSKC